MRRSTNLKNDENENIKFWYSSIESIYTSFPPTQELLEIMKCGITNVVQTVISRYHKSYNEHDPVKSSNSNKLEKIKLNFITQDPIISDGGIKQTECQL